MRTRLQLLRTLTKDIVADLDDTTREVVLTIHWRGGQHSQVRVPKPRSGEHGCRTPGEALAVIRSMAGKWSDEHIAASLNRMAISTGQGKTWNALRVSSIRKINDIPAYLSANKDGQWLPMPEAAAQLGVNHHHIRGLIKAGILAATQVVPRAPYQIRATDLLDQRVVDAIACTKPRVKNLQKSSPQCFQRLSEVMHYEQAVQNGLMAFSCTLLSTLERPSWT
jgi:hypothetical protein